jgi:hypothetical protein
VATSDPQQANDLTTDELVQRLRGGNTDYYEEIVNRYQRETLRIVSFALYDRSQTEEKVRET